MGYLLFTGGAVSSVAGRTGAVVLAVSDISGAAPLASPALTGTPTAPTPATGDNSTTIATTAHVQAKIAANAPGLAPVQSVAGRTGNVVIGPADLSTTAINSGNALQGTTLDGALRGFDALVQGRVKGSTTTTPPASPSGGDAYLVPAGATGAWSGQTDKVTRWSSVLSAWEFYAPKTGWIVMVDDLGIPKRYTGTGWTSQIKVGTGAASSSTTTGDFVVVGGCGIGGKLFVGSGVDVSVASSSVGMRMSRTGNATGSIGYGAVGDRDTTNTYDQFAIYNGAYSKYIAFKMLDTGTIQILTNGFNGKIQFSDQILATNGTASTSTTTGTLVVTGGAGVSGNVYAGGFFSGKGAVGSGGSAGQVWGKNSATDYDCGWLTVSGGSGSGYPPWWGLSSLVAPSYASFSWLNQGTATAGNVGQTLLLSLPAQTGDGVRGLVKAIPAAPYTIDFVWIPGDGAAYNAQGLILLDSVSGKFIMFDIYGNGNEVPYHRVVEWNSVTSSSSVLKVSRRRVFTGPVFMRVTDDGTNRSYLFSIDGKNYETLLTHANTTWITPNQYGFGDTHNDAANPTSLSVLHMT